ncbi:MAG: T9SS type A sorting domain-containing protein [candidate division WOR-3 bacterium]
MRKNYIVFLLVTIFIGKLKGADSPTGRNPMLAWTQDQQEIWNRMKTDNHIWYQAVKYVADANVGQIWNDYGQANVMMYQITGDTNYARTAIQKMRATLFTINWSLDNTREWFIHSVIMYDWLKPYLSLPYHTADKNDFLNCLKKLANAARWSWREYRWPYWYLDTDQLIGTYFGTILYYYATKDENPHADTIYSDPVVGGIQATGCNFETMRNTIAKYCEMGKGGEFIPGSQYSNGDTRLLMMGYYAIKTCLGQEYFPEVRDFIRELGLQKIYCMAGNLEHVFVWGEAESGYWDYGKFSPDSWLVSVAMVQGLTQNDFQVGPYLTQLMEDLTSKYSSNIKNWLNSRALLTYNPYASKSDWRTLPKFYQSPSQGLNYFHNGWNANSTFVGFHMRPKQMEGMDHANYFFSDLQIFRKGEWAFHHPLYYSSVISHSEFENSIIIGGLPAMEENRVVYANESGEDYFYASGETSGHFRPETYGEWYPTPNFVPEWTRSMIYLPSGDGKSETVVLHDRANVLDPRSMPNFNNFWSTHKTRILEAFENFSRSQLVFHSPVPPTKSFGNTYTWSTSSGQNVKVVSLIPLIPRDTIINEKLRYTSDDWGYIDTALLKWQFRIMPITEKVWNTFLTVVQVLDNGVSVTSSLVKSSDNKSEGVLIKNFGRNDCLVMFNADSSTRFLNTGYSISWASETSTDVFLAQLNPAREWNVSIDGSLPIHMSVSEGGLGRVTVSGQGNHQLVLNPGNEIPLPSAPTNLEINSVSVASVELSWQDNSNNETAFYVERSYDGANFTKIGETSSNETSYVDSSISPGSDYFYRVRAHNSAGNSAPSNIVQVTTPSGIDDKEKEKGSSKFLLGQNYPNPFNSRTTINYSVATKSYVSLKIYDLLGREIATLVAGVKERGKYSVEWDGKKTSGQEVESGIYFYQLKTNTGFRETKKMIFFNKI